MDAVVRKEIESLRQLTAKQLRMRYGELFGEESRSGNRMHLFRRVAWRIQANAEGELSARARERALQLADDSELRRRAPGEFWRTLSEPVATAVEIAAERAGYRDPRLPPVGTVLKRSYRGREVEVRVLAQGFEYEGRHYESLSRIVLDATGTRWNGYAFFRLNGEARR